MNEIKIDEPVKKDYNKETKVLIGIMIIVIVVILLAQWLVQKSKKFEYGGFSFYKEKEGDITFYKSLLGYVTASGENIPFILKLRNDPRVLDEIQFEGVLKLKNETILSVSPNIANCSDTYITMIDFARTLKAFGISAKAATTDVNYSKEYNATLADCRNSLGRTVVVMKEGNETKISQEKLVFKDCYVIEIKDCKIGQSFERFLLELIKSSNSGI